MKRIQEIKERLSETEPGKRIDYRLAENLATVWINHYENDVQYLLAENKRYKEAIEIAINHIEGKGKKFSEREKIPVIYQLKQALKEE